VITDGNTQEEFEKFLISEYFSCGSINKVFQKHHYSLPISFAGYDRVLTRYGVVKSAGPNSKLSESLYLLSFLASYKIPLERAYHKFAPKTFQVSSNTLHRILHYTRLGMTRRQGIALIISRQDKQECVLIGKDMSLSDKNLGKIGDFSLPMGYSKIGESPRESILRVLQNEVFTDMVISRQFPFEVVPEHIKPTMYVNIADICVSVYRLEIPSSLKKFSSFKIRDLKYRNINKLSKYSFRAGVAEILDAYKNIDKISIDNEALVFNSDLNMRIYALAKQPIE
jgi:hypothetical protein